MTPEQLKRLKRALYDVRDVHNELNMVWDGDYLVERFEMGAPELETAVKELADLIRELEAVPQPTPTDEQPAAVDEESAVPNEDAEPWVMPGPPEDAEPGFYVMFGETCALWEPHEDAAYVAIGLLLRRYGSAPAVRQALIEEQAALDTAASQAVAAIISPVRPLCA